MFRLIYFYQRHALMIGLLSGLLGGSITTVGVMNLVNHYTNPVTTQVTKSVSQLPNGSKVNIGSNQYEVIVNKGKHSLQPVSKEAVAAVKKQGEDMWKRALPWVLSIIGPLFLMFVIYTLMSEM